MVCLSEREGEGAGFRLACASVRTVRPFASKPKESPVAGGVEPRGSRCGTPPNR